MLVPATFKYDVPRLQCPHEGFRASYLNVTHTSMHHLYNVLYDAISGLWQELNLVSLITKLQSLSIAVLPYHGILYCGISYMFVTYLVVIFVVSLLKFYIFCIQ